MLVFVLVLSACQVRFQADVVTDRRGAGTLQLRVDVDRELAGRLREAGVDLLAGLDELRAAAPAWTIDAPSQNDSAVDTEGPDAERLSLRLQTAFSGPEEFAALTDGLNSALGPEDARLFEGLRLRRTEDGGVAFSGRIGVLLPAAPGVRGVGVAFGSPELRQLLLAVHGDELLRFQLRLTLPALPRQHDADEVDGRRLTWTAPIDSLREVSAVSEVPPRGWQPPVAGLVGLAATAPPAVLMMRRRRRRVGLLEEVVQLGSIASDGRERIEIPRSLR